MYDSWDIEYDRQNFVSFWTIFCSFTPLTTQKIKIMKKRKKHLENYIILQMFPINDYNMMYGSWDMEQDIEFFVILDYFLALWPP